jgi:hypothetical protein
MAMNLILMLLINDLIIFQFTFFQINQTDLKNFVVYSPLFKLMTEYSVFRLGEQGNHKGLPLQEMYLTDEENAI